MGSITSFFNPAEAYGARWTLGAVLLAPLSAVTWGYASVYAILVITAVTIFSSYTCTDLHNLLQLLPPEKTARGRRDRNVRAFLDFMSIWLTFLAHLVAVAICARLLSATADFVTEGKSRRWIFGYEAKSLGEPWPDVLGVTVVLVVCCMFMCGLEENIIFTVMLMVVLCMYSQFISMFGLLNTDLYKKHVETSCNITQVFGAGSQIIYTFSVTNPTSDVSGKIKKKFYLLLTVPLIVLSLICYLHADIVKEDDFSNILPVLSLVKAHSTNWLSHILAAIIVCGASLSLTELCPIVFDTLVILAGPEWKILTRAMTYQSPSTGSPVLAVFTAGSLSAILAFACPLSHMVSLLNASHLISVIIQAFLYTVMRCVPTPEQMEQGDAEYTRLGNKSVEPKVTNSKSAKATRAPWYIPSKLRQTKTLQSLKPSTEPDSNEQELLLLDEYSVEPETSDYRNEVKADGANNEDSYSDDSTDIDEVVKEYKDRVEIVNATPESSKKQIILPSKRGAQLSCAGVCAATIGSALLAVALSTSGQAVPLIGVGIPVFALGTYLAALQPSHKSMSWCLNPVQGPLTLLFNILLLAPLLWDSWPAILMFTGAGVVIYARCERWCGTMATQHVIRARIKAEPLITRSTLRHVDTVYVTS